MKCVLRVVNAAMIHTELYIDTSLIYAASGDVLNCPLLGYLSIFIRRQECGLAPVSGNWITGGFHSNTLPAAAEYYILKYVYYIA
jgi:hypothetical protein